MKDSIIVSLPNLVFPLFPASPYHEWYTPGTWKILLHINLITYKQQTKQPIHATLHVSK